MNTKCYIEATKIIDSNDQLVHYYYKCNDQLVKEAESKLGQKFPCDYVSFLTKYGSLGYGSIDIYGIIDENFNSPRYIDVVWSTLNERKDGMPQNLLFIYNTTMGEIFCLDFENLNEQKEPKVVTYYPGMDNADQPYEILYDSFGEFLLDIIEQETEE